MAGGVFVFVAVAVGPAGPSSEISSNQMLPVGEPSVIMRRVTLVFEALFQGPVTNCQLPAVLVHNVVSPVMSFISIHAPPVVFVLQIQPE